MAEEYELRLSRKQVKAIQKLSSDLQSIVKALMKELAIRGPILHNWPSYGKLRGKRGIHHCHIRKGRPTYVAVWKEVGKGILTLLYIGTHEKADYDRFE